VEGSPYYFLEPSAGDCDFTHSLDGSLPRSKENSTIRKVARMPSIIAAKESIWASQMSLLGVFLPFFVQIRVGAVTLRMKSLIIVTAVLLGVFSHLPTFAEEKEKPWAWRGQTLTEFGTSETNGMKWQVVNDGVMGGLSKGSFAVSDEGILKFAGTLSLENNGGFSSIRSSAVDFNLSNDLGILLKVKGDGRTYSMRLESTATFRGMPVSFSGEFSTQAGEWQQVKIPFSEFKGGWRGRDLPDEVLDPSVIREAGLLIGDKKAGPFSLEVDYIRTYGKGQGEFKERKKEMTSKETPAPKGPKSLIATMEADKRFSTLKAALDAAKLTTFFQWDNKLTVFAPTDEAFAKLPEGTLEDLLKPENKERLVQILSLHVHPGSLGLAQALGSDGVKTVEGTPLKLAFEKGSVKVNGSSLVEADITCADGTIHVIDSVLLPEPKKKTLLSTAQSAGSFQTLLAAAKVAGLESALEGDDELTVFAPTDDAFAALPEGTVENLLKEENRKQLVELLTTHVVSGKVSAGDALNANSAKSLSGTELIFAIEDGLFTVSGSVVRNAGIDGGNGTIHVISSVIGFPETKSAGSEKYSSEGCDKQQTAPPKTTSVEGKNASEMILSAIHQGVPLYNSGQIEECASVYESCLVALSESKRLDQRTRTMIGEVATAGKKYNADRRAWFYRSALDQMMHLMAQSRG